MGYPAKAKTWTISPNNTITYVSLLDTMERYLKGMADFLLAHGYTCKGSCDGTTGAMDGVNRWVTLANVGTRGATTVAANSWMVLTDANGCNILLSYVGATDDVARLSYSPGGLYVVAGTTTFTPTATDEQVLATGITLIGTNTSGDRIWHGWVDSASKLCRFVIYRGGVLIGPVWGVELVNPRTTRVFSPAVWGFCYLAAQFVLNNGVSGFTLAYSANNRGGLTRVAGSTVQVGGGVLTYLLNNTGWGDVQTENQGGVGYPMFGPLSLGSNTTSFQGALAYTYDWWTGRNTITPGDTLDSKNFIQLQGTSPVWPWDGSTTPQTGGAPATQPGNAHANLAELNYSTAQLGNPTDPDMKVYTASQVFGGLGV